MIKYLKVLVTLMFVFLLCACAESKSLAPLASDDVILAFGDSLTVGVGAAESLAYPAVLARLTDRSVISAGVSGEETSQGLKRLPSVLDEVQPNLVILLEGGNDILRNRNLQQTKNNLAKMIELIQDRGIELILVGVPEKKLFSDVAPFYQELANEYELVFAEDNLSDLLRNNEYKSDPVHLNQQGYRLLAESFHELLVEHGAL